MEVTIIGVDCATQDSKVGLALGCLADGEARIEEVTLGARVKPVAAAIARWAGGSPSTLLALDAPLGWPVDLADSLVTHTAGKPLRPGAAFLFKRETDRFVEDEVKQRPLEVGADKIARTARAALEMLQEVRKLTGQPIPLAWDRKIGAGLHAIEVYPAATLKAHNNEVPTYKGKDREAERSKILAFLAEQVRLPEDRSLMAENDNALDAGLCVLAAVDFLRGEVMEPRDRQKARKEGWIWVRG